MANRIKGITVEIGGDATKLQTALKGVNGQIKNTQSALRDVEKLLKLDPHNTELLSQKQKLLTQAIGETKEKLTTLKTVAEQANEQLQKGDITQAQYDALQREIIETEAELKKLEQQASSTNANLAKIGDVGSKIESVGNEITNVGKKVSVGSNGNRLIIKYLKYMVTFEAPENLTYDGNAKTANITKNDTALGEITVNYYDQADTKLEQPPVDVGTYTVKITVADSTKYVNAEVGKFTIVQAINSFTNKLAIIDWTWGDSANAPTATAKFGTPTFTYAIEEDGTYTETVPTAVGTYWVKATVVGTENYTGLEAKETFTIVPKTYAITYVSGANGIGTITAGNKTHGVAFTLSADTFTRDGYPQIGWTTTDGGVKVYDLGDSYTVDAAVTLYPAWTINQYTITVKPENGDDDITIKQDYGTTVTAPILTRGGYVFDGWDKTFPTTMPAENMTITTPTISGIENGKTYCKEQTVTVTDNNGIASVTANGIPVTLDANGKFTLSPAKGTQTVVATDKAGHVSAEMIVTVNDGHEGGTATCKDKAVCDYCGKPYGELNGSNHADGTEVRNAKDATCTEGGYTGDTYCKGCETKLSSGKSVDKTGHDYESKVTKEATTTSTGIKTYTCKNCGHSYEEEIAKLPSQSTSPKTGDETPLAMTIAVTTLSAVALAVLLLLNKKEK